MNGYLCEDCAHWAVCINKGVYRSFQDAVNKLEITVPCALNQNRVLKMEGIPWLQPTKLECVNFLYQRGSDRNEQ